MNMIGHQVALLDPALLPSCQTVKYLAQVPLDFLNSSFLRYFGVNTTWYLHSQVA